MKAVYYNHLCCLLRKVSANKTYVRVRDQWPTLLAGVDKKRMYFTDTDFRIREYIRTVFFNLFSEAEPCAAILIVHGS